MLPLAWASPLRFFLLSFLLPEDLLAQNIDVVLNRRSCMAAALRIIEENIPEVRPLDQYQAWEAAWDRWHGVRDRLASDPLTSSTKLFSPLQLLSLNLSDNRLFRLDDMSTLVQKAPNLKILNLSGNEVRIDGLAVLLMGWAEDIAGLPGDGDRQEMRVGMGGVKSS